MGAAIDFDFAAGALPTMTLLVLLFPDGYYTCKLRFYFVAKGGYSGVGAGYGYVVARPGRCPATLLQTRHLHQSVQATPSWKHSQ